MSNHNLSVLQLWHKVISKVVSILLTTPVEQLQ